MENYKVKKGSHQESLILFIAEKGAVYKQDALAYVLSLCDNKSYASRTLNKTISDGFLSINDFTVQKGYKGKKSTVSVVTVTPRGLDIANSINEEYEDVYKCNVERFDSINTKLLLSKYNQNHIKTAFNIAGIRTDQSTKPSLEQLYCHIRGFEYSDSLMNEYYSVYADDYMEYLYKQGIYYTIQEYREFYKNMLGGEEALTSIAKGIYISKDKVLVVYSNGKFNDSMIYMPTVQCEKELIESLKEFRFARIEYRNGFKFGLAALTISDTNSFIYSTLANRKYGRTETNKVKYLPNIFSLNSTINNLEESTSYAQVYSIVFNETGFSSLKYLVSNSYSSWLSECCEFAEQKPDTIKVNEGENKKFPLSYKIDWEWYPCTYLPYFELHILNDFREIDFAPIIITHKELTNVISHCTHKQHLFIDADTLEPIDSNDTLIYDERGYNKGKQMILEYLQNSFQTVDDQQLRELPKIYEMDFIEFWNSVAKGVIKLEDIAKLLETKEYEDKKYYKKPMKVSKMPFDIYNEYQNIAKENNISMYQAVKMVSELGFKCLNLMKPDIIYTGKYSTSKKGEE